MNSIPDSITLADAEDRLRAVTTFDRNVVVTAGAGTGKTALLTERLLNLFFRKEDPAKPAQCAALTFTNRAAGEMAERLREYLERFVEWSAAEGPPSQSTDVAAKIYGDIAGRYGLAAEDMARIARDTLRDLELAPIATYHSFAARLLKLYPLQSGVDPSFQEDDGTVLEERFTREWEGWLSDELQAGSPHDALWRKAFEAFDLSVLEALAKNLCSELFSLEALEGALDKGELFEAPGEWLNQEIEDAKGIVEQFEKERNIERHTRIALEMLEGFRDGLPEESLWELANEMNSGTRSQPKGMTDEVYEACRRTIRVADGLASLNRKAVRTALELLLPFAEKFRAGFVRAGFLHFDSLLVRARDLLRDHPEVRKELKRRYRHLLVDEFQDTDPIQYEIVLYLAEEAESAARAWRDVRLEPGKLFIVGDPKQSVYKFRGADIEAYHGLLGDVLLEKPLELSVNFRSHDRIVGAVNGMFGRVIQADGKIQPEYLSAEPRPGGPASLPAQKVEVRVVRPEDGPGWNAEAATAGEARETARWIQEDLVGHAEIPGSGNEVRSIKYGDVALLFRKTSNFGVYVDALRERGIPHVVEAGRGFFETQEVTDFLNLLACLAYPEDRLAWAGVLRSPLGGLTDRELYDWARAHTGQGKEPPAAADLRERVRAVRERIHRLPVSEALEEIFGAFPVQESATLLSGEQGRNNVLKVRSMALERDETLQTGFAGLVDWLRGRGREIREEGESPLAEENVDAVKVLTVHKAKGLEFPVVVLAGFHAGGRPPLADVRLKRDWSSGHWALKVGSVQTPGDVWAEGRESLLGDMEERRLFYVAATRAQERLVLSVATRNGPRGRPAKAEGFLAYLNEALDMDVRDESAEWPPDWQGKIERVFASPPFSEGAAATEMEAVAWPAGFEEAWRKRKERMENTRKRFLDIRPSHMGDEEGEHKIRDPETGAPPPSTAFRAGSVAHKVLERIDLREPPQDIDGAVQAALEEALPEVSEDERREIRDEVTQMLKDFLASKTFREDIQPFEILGREVPCFLPDGEEGSAEGYIDLVIRDRAGILAIDYKSDRKVQSPNATEYAKKKYRKQGEVYARALASVFGAESVRFGVAFLRTPVLATWTPEKG